MAPEYKFIHSYCNSIDGPGSVQATLINNDIINPNRSFCIRSSPGEKLFCTEEAMQGYQKGWPIGNPITRNLRSEDAVRVATLEDFASLLSHVNEMRRFMDNVRDNGKGLLSLPQEIFKRAVAKGVISSLPIAKDGWHHRIGLGMPIQADVPIEDLVEIIGILLPLHDPYSDVRFEYTKKCVICGKFYQAKGSKAIYCSERCRSRARNQQTREVKTKI